MTKGRYSFTRDLFNAGRQPADVVMPCDDCGEMPARKVNYVGVEKRLCAKCMAREHASHFEIWNS
ncbi:hypothetical protein D3C86_1792090 [compost metagenome]